MEGRKRRRGGRTAKNKIKAALWWAAPTLCGDEVSTRGKKYAYRSAPVLQVGSARVRYLLIRFGLSCDLALVFERGRRREIPFSARAQQCLWHPNPSPPTVTQSSSPNPPLSMHLCVLTYPLPNVGHRLWVAVVLVLNLVLVILLCCLPEWCRVQCSLEWRSVRTHTSVYAWSVLNVSACKQAWGRRTTSLGAIYFVYELRARMQQLLERTIWKHPNFGRRISPH